MGDCQARRHARPVRKCIRTCARVELWGVHHGVFSVAGGVVVAGHAATEGDPRRAVPVRKDEYGHIRSGKRGIWSGPDRTVVWAMVRVPPRAVRELIKCHYTSTGSPVAKCLYFLSPPLSFLLQPVSS